MLPNQEWLIRSLRLENCYFKFVLRFCLLKGCLYCRNKLMYQTMTASLFDWLATHSRLAAPSIHVLCEVCFVASLKMPWFRGQVSI